MHAVERYRLTEGETKPLQLRCYAIPMADKPDI